MRKNKSMVSSGLCPCRELFIHLSVQKARNPCPLPIITPFTGGPQSQAPQQKKANVPSLPEPIAAAM